MSQNTENNRLVNTYIKQIEEKLPEWLKDKKKELNDVLEELKQHLWDKIEEIAQGQQPALVDVQKAIASMGTPDQIAKEYKRRGTPKVFISQELWPYYVKGIKILVGILLFFNILSFVISVAVGDIGNAFLNLWSGMFNGFILGTFVITLIFTLLSMEGYLPDDFKSKKEQDEVKELRQKGITETIEKVDNPIKMGELIFGTIAGLIFGFMLLTQITSFLDMPLNPKFIDVLRFSGLIIIISGIIHFGRVMLGQKSITGHQILIGIDTLVGLFGIPIALIIVNNPEIVPFFNLINEQDVYNGVALGFKIVIGLTIIGSISNAYEAITLRSKYEKYQKYKNLFV